MRIKIAVIYSAALSALALFFGVWELARYLGIAYSPAFSIIAGVGLFPIIYLKRDYVGIVSSILFTCAIAGLMLIAPSFMQVPGDPMNSFIMFLAAVLILTSIHDSLLTLYSGLSFYIVGVFILLAFAAMEITIFLANLADYYINCIGTTCPAPHLGITPGMMLLLLALPATYPYFHRNEFRRDIHDKEGS